MKTLKDYKEDYYFNTGKASEINRALSLSGIAIIWIFNKSEKNVLVNIPSELMWPLALFFIAIALDLFQYFIGGLIWWVFYLCKEAKGVQEEDKLQASYLLPLPMHIFYFLKIIVNICAFIMLNKYLISFILK